MSTAVLEPPEILDFCDEAVSPEEPGPGFEFVDGELRELNVSQLSNYVAGECYGFLRDHVRPRRLGWVFTDGNSYRCFPADPKRVRRPDASFHLLVRRTIDEVMTEGHSSVCPDLVVEVVSPGDSADDVNRKRIEWQRAGATLVWVIHPLDQTLHAYRADGTVRLFTASETLTAEPVLPDFQVSMAELFRMPTAG